MKKMISIIILFYFFSTNANSQAIRFEPLSWRDALAKAKRENKMIFIDVYTTWCTYCRQMDQTIFPDEEVGNFYNKHFINLKYDALKADGIQVRKTYTIAGFPAFLYLDPNGLVIGKTSGYQDKDIFISHGSTAFSLAQKKEEAN